MGQIKIRKRRARSSLPALHIENAAFLCYWRRIIIRYILYDHDDIELCIQ